MAYGIKPSHNGRLLQNLILGANYLQSHLVHFYQLSALDFVDVTAVLKYNGSDSVLKSIKKWVQMQLADNKIYPAAPFLPRYDGDYIKNSEVNWTLLAHYAESLEIRRLSHEAAAVFGAKLPHSTSIVPGGCTQVPTLERILAYRSRLQQVQDFVNNVFLPDIVTAAKAFPKFWNVGKGYGNLMCYGVFDMNDNQSSKMFMPGVLINGKWETFDQGNIAEQIGYSRYSSASNLHPASGSTKPDPKKSKAYSWLKAPRYKGLPIEVGPLARVMVNYHAPGGSWVKDRCDKVFRAHGIKPEMMYSILGRHLCRALETIWIAESCNKWLSEIQVDKAPANDFNIPLKGRGYGLTEAPRGALGHWIEIDNYKIKNYQCVVPTTWNCSPKDDSGVPGPVEKALVGAPVENPGQPLDVGRLVRSFDPCIACAVH
jgi:ferredoxin hydrogenase large subunit/hydrogenase large subunit